MAADAVHTGLILMSINVIDVMPCPAKYGGGGYNGIVAMLRQSGRPVDLSFTPPRACRCTVQHLRSHPAMFSDYLF